MVDNTTIITYWFRIFIFKDIKKINLNKEGE